MTTRLPRAPEAPLPELAEFLAPLEVHFVQRPSAKSLERYVTGLLTEHPTKNCDTLAQVVPATSGQRLQYLLTDMAWDHADLNRQRVRRMLELPTEGDGVLVFDDTGFAKQGMRSVGVQRQYSGTLGKTGNCQVAVTCHYAERTLAWPVGVRLYLPKRWAEDRDLRRAAHVPDDVGACVIHNDFRLDNVVLDPDDLTRVTGVLDAIVHDARALAAGDHRSAVRSVAGGSREHGRHDLFLRSFDLVAIEAQEDRHREECDALVPVPVCVAGHQAPTVSRG